MSNKKFLINYSTPFPMNIDPKRLARQQQIGKKFWEQGGKGSFLAATGFGKTYTALLIIYALQRRFPTLKTTVAVPSDYLRDQWRERLKAKRLDNVKVDTVHMIVKNNHDTDFLILDEMHSYTSPVFSGIFEVVNYKFILGMTATLREDPERNQIIHQHMPVFDEVTLQECLDNGWVSPFIVYNYGLELTDTERRYYKDLSGKFNKAFGLFGHNLGTAFKCLNDDLYCKKYADRIGWNPGAVKGQAATMSRNMSERKQFLYNYPALAETAKYIIDQYGEGRKIITFSQSTDAVDHLTNLLIKDGHQAMSYHSNLDTVEIDGVEYSGKDLKNKVKELYEGGQIDILNTAKALDQGVDIEDIDMSLVCSGTSSILQAVQRTGRGIRAKNGKRACEVNLFIRDTQSEKWLRKRQRKHPQTTLKYISNINEIVL